MSNLKDSLRKTYNNMLADEELKYISGISCYNHNYYVGAKRENNAVHDLIYVESDDDNYSEYYLVLSAGHFVIGHSFTSEGDIIHFNEDCTL